MKIHFRFFLSYVTNSQKSKKNTGLWSFITDFEAENVP